jgi:hypothetical protein
VVTRNSVLYRLVIQVLVQAHSGQQGARGRSDDFYQTPSPIQRRQGLFGTKHRVWVDMKLISFRCPALTSKKDMLVVRALSEQFPFIQVQDVRPAIS